MVNMAPNEVEKRRSNGERSTVEDDGGALARTILECLCGTDAEKGKNATISDREDAVAETWHPGSEAFRSRSPNPGGIRHSCCPPRCGAVPADITPGRVAL